MSKKPTKPEAYAKDFKEDEVRDMKKFIQYSYGTHFNWYENFLAHKDAVLSLPKYKNIKEMIIGMEPIEIKRRMMYAVGDYEKPSPPPPPPPPPEPEDDALADFFFRSWRYADKTENEQRALLKAKRAELKKKGETPEEFLAKERAENKRIADARVARAREADAKRRTPYDYQVEERKRAEEARKRATPITHKPFPPPTTGGGRSMRE